MTSHQDSLGAESMRDCFPSLSSEGSLRECLCPCRTDTSGLVYSNEIMRPTNLNEWVQKANTKQPKSYTYQAHHLNYRWENQEIECHTTTRQNGEMDRSNRMRQKRSHRQRHWYTETTKPSPVTGRFTKTWSLLLRG